VSLLTEYGELLLEGTFRIHGAKHPRRLFLFEEMLLIAKAKPPPDDAFVCKDFILVRTNVMRTYVHYMYIHVYGRTMCRHVRVRMYLRSVRVLRTQL